MKIGEIDFKNGYVGDSPAKKIYLGETLLWPAEPAPQFVSWIYTTVNENKYIELPYIQNTATTIDIVWRYHFNSTGIHIGTTNCKVFATSKTALYFDWNVGKVSPLRLTANLSPALNTETILNWQIGNRYIFDKTNEKYIVSGSTESVLNNTQNLKLNISRMYFQEITISENGVPIIKAMAALDENGVPSIYDTIGKKFYYYGGTQEYLDYIP